MPGTASTRNTDRERPRTRPSAAAREAASQATPVLFRLPLVTIAQPNDSPEEAANDVSPAVAEPSAVVSQAASGPVVSQNEPATGRTAVAASASVPDVAAVPESSPGGRRTWWEHWSSGVVLILLIIALVTASIIALNDGAKTPGEQLASDASLPALDEFDLSSIVIPNLATAAVPATNLTPTSPAAGGPTASSPTTPSPAATTASPSVAVSTAPAGAPASVNPVEAVGGATLTSSPVEVAAAQSGSSLSLDTVSKPSVSPSVESVSPNLGLELTAAAAPKLASPLELTATTSTPAGTVSSTASTENNLASPALNLTAAQPASPAGVAASAPNANSPNSTPINASGPQLASAAPQVDTPQADSRNAANTLGTPAAAPATVATLALPISSEPSQLFATQPADAPRSTAVASQPSATAGVPSVTVSTPVGASPTLPTPASPKGNVPGSSPAFYDGAAINADLHAATAATESGDRPIDTNLPSFATVFASAAGPVGASSPTGATTAVAIPTTTPELDTAAIIKAYLPYRQLNQAQNGTLTNLYGSNAALPAQRANMPAASNQPTAAGNGSGFTLGSPRQGTISAPAYAR